MHVSLGSGELLFDMFDDPAECEMITHFEFMMGNQCMIGPGSSDTT